MGQSHCTQPPSAHTQSYSRRDEDDAQLFPSSQAASCGSTGSLLFCSAQRGGSSVPCAQYINMTTVTYSHQPEDETMDLDGYAVRQLDETKDEQLHHCLGRENVFGKDNLVDRTCDMERSCDIGDLGDCMAPREDASAELTLQPSRRRPLHDSENVSREDDPDEQRTQEVFNVFDRNGDGLIDAADLKELMSYLGEELSNDDANYMIQAADNDGDGKINYHDFYHMMNWRQN